MLTIKPTTSPSADPDPAGLNINSTQIIFVQDEPQPTQLIPDEPQPQAQIATRIQGGQVANIQQGQIDPKEAQQDIPEPILSDEYKKGMHNKTKIEDQGPDGNVNILEDAIIASEEQREKQVIPPMPIVSQTNQLEKSLILAPNDIETMIQPQEKQIVAAEILKAIIQKTSELTKTIADKSDSSLSEEAPQLEAQKIISKKHRPADIGPENISKVQLSKQTQENNIPKKKMSLLDIQTGFNQFIKNSSTREIATPTSSVLGNSLYFSSTGNAQKDDELGLKLASYLNQTGRMYDSACSLYSNFIIKLLRQNGLPAENNTVQITIERSGKISAIKTIQSCGNEAIDNYHIKIVEAIGDLPPIPKYIEAPLCVGARFTFKR